MPCGFLGKYFSNLQSLSCGNVKQLHQTVKITSAVILVLNVVTGIVVIALIVTRTVKRQPNVSTGFCVPCDETDLKTSEVNIKTGVLRSGGVKLDRRRDDTDQEICCGSDSTQQTAILDEIYDKTLQDFKKKNVDKYTEPEEDDTSYVPLEFLSLLKPIAHMTGITDVSDEDKTKTNYSGVVPVRNWYRFGASSRMLTKNGMRLQNGSIIVPTSGLYRVYSSVKFYIETPTEKQNQLDGGKPFVHKIFRYDAASDREVEILSNSHSKCETVTRKFKEYPSYISGIVYLNTADSLTVKVSHMSELSVDRDWHYFGAHLL